MVPAAQLTIQVRSLFIHLTATLQINQLEDSAGFSPKDLLLSSLFCIMSGSAAVVQALINSLEL